MFVILRLPKYHKPHELWNWKKRQNRCIVGYTLASHFPLQSNTASICDKPYHALLSSCNTVTENGFGTRLLKNDELSSEDEKMLKWKAFTFLWLFCFVFLPCPLSGAGYYILSSSSFFFFFFFFLSTSLFLLQLTWYGHEVINFMVWPCNSYIFIR